MRFRLGNLRVPPGVMALAFVSLIASGGRAQDKPPVKVSGGPAATTNEVVNRGRQLGSAQDGLKQLEDELFKPMRDFAPKSSLDGAFVPPVRPPAGPVIQSKRIKELLEQRKNWMFMNPEDLTAGPAGEGFFKVPEYDANGQDKQKISPLEQFFQGTGHRRTKPSAWNQMKQDDFSGGRKRSDGSQEMDSEDDSNSSNPIIQSEKRLKKLFGSDSTANPKSPAPLHTIFSDIFSPGDPSSVLERTEAQKTRMDEFKQLLGNPVPPAVGNDLLNLTVNGLDPAHRLANPAGSLSGLPASSHGGAFGAQQDALNPILSPKGVQDVTARYFERASGLGTPLPKPESKPLPPPPTFTIPQRKF